MRGNQYYMSNNKILIVLITICSSFSISAQKLQIAKPSDSASIGKLLKYDTKIVVKSVGNSFTQPLRWEKKDFIKMGTLIGGTLLLSFADESANEFFAKQEPHVPEFIKDFGYYAGKPLVYFTATAGIYGFGLLTKNEKVRKAGVLIMASSVTTGVFQSVMKYSVGRARPSEGVGSTTFHPFTNEPGYHSFPSGHTILSVTLAHSIAKQFDNVWAKIGIYAVGSITPISRLWAGAHWLTDVAFSTVFSIVVVDGIDKYLFKTKAYDYPKKEKMISWDLKFSNNQIGLIGTF